MKLLADASLPELNQAFAEPFVVTLYHDHDELVSKLPDQDILLCRSTLKVNAQLLEKSSLKFVATASSGVDHIDQDYLKKNNIELISAKGANAQAVADYVIACLARLEKNNSIKGRQAGVIGLGEVGSRVSQALEAIGFKVKAYDPPKAVRETAFQTCSLDDLLTCDVLCVHAELHDRPPYPSRNLLNREFLNLLADQTVIINASRGGIVNEADLLALDKAFIYCVDVYSNEPDINPEIIHYATLCTPHIAGHSVEAKSEAIFQISRSLYQLNHLPHPEIKQAERPALKPKPHQHWQDLVLSLYDPMDETKVLKQAESVRDAFLALRKAHRFRHDFNL